MSDKKIIAVGGATGAQGGGLVRAILADTNSEFAVRAIARDASSPAARALAEAGATVVTADIDDQASLADALRGAYGAFFVTFYWAHGSAARETQNARNMASAARTADIRHAIWSTLEDTRRLVRQGQAGMPVLGGEYNVPHMDAKGVADRHFAEFGVPTTYLLTSFYWENLITFGMGPRLGPDGRLVFALPMGDAKLPGIGADDIGVKLQRDARQVEWDQHDVGAPRFAGSGQCQLCQLHAG